MWVCNFELCEACSKLPQKVSHGFHPEHPLEFCPSQHDRQPKYVVCSGCGCMSSGAFYECKECETYLDLGCALLKNIVTCWETEDLLHDSHSHLVRRCRPGPDTRGSCLLCELPLSPSAICYGCVHCYVFFHERCMDLPTEIRHPVHLAHPLRRLDYTHSCGGGRNCNACGDMIVSVPFSCLECGFDLHMRCADSLLRGLIHKSHEHRLFYVPKNAHTVFKKGSPCQICLRPDVISLDNYYHCVECELKFHFECLQIPESIVKKCFHIHPLVCKILPVEEYSLEYCGVCETIIHAGYHAYSCKECDFLGHIECILREEEPSPLYLKHLSSCGKDVTRITNPEEKKLLVIDIKHNHVMKLLHMCEFDDFADCNICGRKIFGSPYKCETCNFHTHQFCAELGKPSRNRFHLNHPMILLPKAPENAFRKCDICKWSIYEFNLFCRICNFIIHIRCALQDKHLVGELGQKVVGVTVARCKSKKHTLVEVVVSRSYQTVCAICDEVMYRYGLSCMTCGEIYHPYCIRVWDRGLLGHPLHSDHILLTALTSGSECLACRLSITEYGYNCYICKINFHIDCIEERIAPVMIGSHRHYLYNFWINDFQSTQACSVCGRPCGASFYGCIACNFNAHVECVGFPDNVRNQRHQHTLKQTYSKDKKSCSICRAKCQYHIYTCNHCSDVFHTKCIMSTGDRENATEEEQLQDIYLMYLERELIDL